MATSEVREGFKVPGDAMIIEVNTFRIPETRFLLERSITRGRNPLRIGMPGMYV
jgi:hypothetical protein